MPAFPLPFFIDAGASTDRPDSRLRDRIAACASLVALTPAASEAHFSGLEKPPTEASFFHVGRRGDSVCTQEITTAGVKHLHCSPATFNFGKNRLSPETRDNLGQGSARFFSHLNSPGSFNTTTTP